MKFSFATMSLARKIGTGYTFKGEIGDWYMLSNDGTIHQQYVCLDKHRNLLEQTEIDPRKDFDFIPV